MCKVNYSTGGVLYTLLLLVNKLSGWYQQSYVYKQLKRIEDIIPKDIEWPQIIDKAIEFLKDLKSKIPDTNQPELKRLSHTLIHLISTR